MASVRKNIEKKQAEAAEAETERKATEGDRAKCEALEKAVQVEENHLKGLKAEMKSYQDRVKAVEKEIELVGGDSIQRKRAEVKKAADHYASTQKEINSTKVKVRSTRKAIVQLGEENTRLQKEIADAEQAIAAAKAQFEAIEKEAVNVLKAFETAQKAQVEKEKQMKAMAKAYEAEKKKNVEQEGELSQLEEKASSLQQDLEETKAQEKVWVAKIETLRKKTWENTKELEEEEEEKEMEMEKEKEEEMEVEKEEEMEVEKEKEMEVEKEEMNPLKRVIPDVSDERLAQVDKSRVERNIIRLQAECENLKRNVNLSTIAEWARVGVLTVGSVRRTRSTARG